MKALIRNDGETVKETDGIEGIDWITGAPLTRPDWVGGPYTLIDNYVEDREDEVLVAEPEQIVKAAEPVAEVPKVYHINGRDYSEDELRAMLNQ